MIPCWGGPCDGEEMPVEVEDAVTEGGILEFVEEECGQHTPCVIVHHIYEFVPAHTRFEFRRTVLE